MESYHVKQNEPVGDAHKQRVLSYMATGIYHTAKELCANGAYGRTEMLRVLKALVEDGRVESFGETSGKRWRRIA